MMIATQVAYLDAPQGVDVKVSDLIERTISHYSGRSNLSAMEKSQLEYAQNLKATIEENKLYDCNYWIVKQSSNDNQQSGFYGCLIDTRDGDAIVGFRGSETMADPNQLKKDWGEADLGLLNNADTTAQQELAQKFTQEIYERYGGQYEGFSFTGHSLGGNLAGHATVTAPDGMPVRRCISYDGPGYSDEYIQRYGDQIARRSGLIDHYQYSVVGTLLNPLPGTNYRTIAAHNGDGVPPFSLITRHSTENIEFDGYGNVQPGETDPLSATLGPISRGIENGPPAELWRNCPLLAILWTVAESGPELLRSMKQQAEQMAASIQNVIQNIRSAVKTWFRNMFGVRLTGEFEVSVSYLNSLGGELDGIARKFSRISGDVRSIADRLRYNSIAGSYYKSRLKWVSNSLNSDSRKASSLAGAVRGCGQRTASSDSRASQLFQAL